MAISAVVGPKPGVGERRAAIRAEVGSRQLILMALQDGDLLPGRGIPNPRGLVIGGGDYRSAVGAEVGIEDPAVVPARDSGLPTAGTVP